MSDPISSPGAYQAFVYGLPEQFPGIRRSTLVYIPTGELFGRVEGMLLFNHDTVLCVREYLNFELGVIEGYGYEVSLANLLVNAPAFPAATQYCEPGYTQKDRLYWYDSFPHPNDPSLAATDPHHKHIPPDIKHHRVLAPDLSFTTPNLPFLIREIEQLLGGGLESGQAPRGSLLRQ
jgi:hypothetical protein